MKSISRDEVLRWVSGPKSQGGSGAGGGSVDLAGYATQIWTEQNYVNKEFFSSLFKAYDANGNEVLPNDTDTQIDNIKAMFGFWTEFYVSALGTGGQSTVGLRLAQLADVNVAGVTNGQVLTYDTTSGKWIASTPQSGTDMATVWTNLAASGNQQINASHLSTALAGYATQTWVGQQGFATTAWVNQQGFATTAWVNQQGFSTTAWVNSRLSNYLPLAGGAMVAGARISGSGGELYLGNANNASWLMLADTCSQSGSSYWKIYASGNATFANVLSNGYVSALSDEREKNIIENFEVSLKYIAEAPVISYTWKDTERRGDKQHIGSIAQYWLREMPELVPEVNGRYTMDYGRIALLCAILIARYVVNLIERITRLEKTLRGE